MFCKICFVFFWKRRFDRRSSFKLLASSIFKWTLCLSRFFGVSLPAALLDEAAWKWKRGRGAQREFCEQERGGGEGKETTFPSVVVLLGSCSQDLPSRSHFDACHTSFCWNYVDFNVWFLLYFSVTRKGSVRSHQVPKRRSFDPRQGWWYRTLKYRKSLRWFSAECRKIKTK